VNNDVVDRGAVARGALAGGAILGVVAVAILVTQDHVAHFTTSGWANLFKVFLLAAYFVAGWVAGKRAVDSPMTNGLLAGGGAMVLYIPLRIVIWLVRDEGKPLISGHDPALPLGSVVLGIMVGAVIGLFGAILAARSQRASRRAPDA
jgi:drug/metabolite transporter (DMT)-like permease